MPKQLSVLMTVPSGSRPSAMLGWLNRLLNPHGMEVTSVTDDAAMDKARPANDMVSKPCGICRIAGNENSLALVFNDRPTDDEMRKIMEIFGG